jgi:ABC-2 type transport system permease protein
MSMIATYTKYAILDLCRNRSAFIFGIIFPVLLFLLFGHSNNATHFDQIGSFVVFCNYAVQTVMFLSLGMSVSMRRSSEWTIYLRTLPAPAYASILGTVFEKTLSAFVALILVVGANIAIYGMLLSWQMTLYTILAAMGGALPMAFLGVALGYRVSADSGRSVFVFLNLMLLFSAWMIPDHGWWLYLRMLIPAHHWARIVMSHYEAGDSTVLPWVWMAGYTLLFYLLAQWSYNTRKNLRRA